MPRYDARTIEAKWQAYWERHQTFQVTHAPDKPKLYVLDMFPYPSGEGLHVGHPEGYTATDIVCRYQRMRGKHVLHPMGWDAFGLPAEQHALQTGTHPAVTTARNIATFKRQLKMLGFSYDWSRELATTDPAYYRWTQWIFLLIYDTWYDPTYEWTGPDGRRRRGKGRPIAELPIPPHIQAQGNTAVRRYQDAHRLAYLEEAPVNWCPALGTVLANEEVTPDGRSERGNHPVERRRLTQWMLRITAYAERLLEELDDLDWPESIKLLQRNWIGRSQGAEVDFPVLVPGFTELEWSTWREQRRLHGFPLQPEPHVLRIYTTRPDTLYGVTYMVLAPEHPLVSVITTPQQRAAVEAYQQQAARKSDLDRTDLARVKTGVFTGGYAVHPLTGQQIPVWIADYVLASYGTGAIMAVPAHDTRDLEFARQYQLPIIPVVQPADPQLEPIGFTGEGTAIHSQQYDGLSTRDFQQRITHDLAQAGLGRAAVNYRLRDWLFSRQRYWGEPFPIWHELDEHGQPTGLVRPVPEHELPVMLPDLPDFRPTGQPEPLLAKAPTSWLYTTAPDGTRLKRETNTMPQWAGSCWYYLRFCDPHNHQRLIDPELERHWLPVDLYIGGAEHAVLHLLYARFWHKVLFDRGYVSTPEPFRKLVNQGMILGEMEYTGYRLETGETPGPWVSARDVQEETLTTSHGAPVRSVKLSAEEVEKQGEAWVLKADPHIVVAARSYKMSKSRGNVINPDQVVAQYGADALRMYEMFMGPLEATKPWSMAGVEGIARFLGRVWRLIIDERAETMQLHPAVQDVPPTPEQQRWLHRTIKAVTEDIDTLSFNTAISRMMEFVNALTACEVRPRAVLEPFVLLLSPFAPHLAEELWQQLGHAHTLAYEPWPQFDPALLIEEEVEVAVQVNGKVRGRIRVPRQATQSEVETLARQLDSVQTHLRDKIVQKVVFVPGRLLSFVVR